MGYPTFNPGFVDIYDVTEDCRDPQLRSSTPLGVLGHESGFAPDGNTFYALARLDRAQAEMRLANELARVNAELNRLAGNRPMSGDTLAVIRHLKPAAELVARGERLEDHHG
jgi:hypothetical protein